jgi:rod shape-determining protein MreD
VRTAVVLGALAAALLLQTLLAGISMAAGSLVNLVLVAVVYVALGFGPVTGLLAGTAGGLAQDALSGGIVGIGGLSKTLLGFVVGVLSAQFIVSQPLPRFVMFVGATVVHEYCFRGLYALVESRSFTMHYSSMLTQAVINGAVGILAFQIVEKSPTLLASRRSRRASLGRRNY